MVGPAFVKGALLAGCPEDQMRDFVAARMYLQARQLAASAAAALKCDLAATKVSEIVVRKLRGLRAGG